MEQETAPPSEEPASKDTAVTSNGSHDKQDEGNLLGFDMPSGQMESSGEAPATQDFLGFSAAPAPVDASNGHMEDLLGFPAASTENTTVAPENDVFGMTSPTHSVADNTTDVLLDFASPVPATNENAPHEDLLGFASTTPPVPSEQPDVPLPTTDTTAVKEEKDVAEELKEAGEVSQDAPPDTNDSTPAAGAAVGPQEDLLGFSAPEMDNSSTIIESQGSSTAVTGADEVPVEKTPAKPEETVEANKVTEENTTAVEPEKTGKANEEHTTAAETYESGQVTQDVSLGSNPSPPPSNDRLPDVAETPAVEKTIDPLVKNEISTPSDVTPHDQSSLESPAESDLVVETSKPVKTPETTAESFPPPESNRTADTKSDTMPPTDSQVAVEQESSPATESSDEGSAMEAADKEGSVLKPGIDVKNKVESTNDVMDSENNATRQASDEPNHDGTKAAYSSLKVDGAEGMVVENGQEGVVTAETVAKNSAEGLPQELEQPASEEPVMNNNADSKEASTPEESTEKTDDSNADPVAVATMAMIPPSDDHAESSSVAPPKETDTEKDEIIVELQSSLQHHMTRQAEAEDRARLAEARITQLEEELQKKEAVERNLREMKERVKSVVADKANLELEVAKERKTREEHERKEIVLSNRVNAAKKKEAEKANLAEQLESEVKQLQAELDATKDKLKNTEMAEQKTEQEMVQTKQELTQRVKLAESALADERRLNEDRKKKMKAFIETKQEEVREAKEQNDELNAELEQTSRLLREQTSRWKQLHAQWVQSQTRNRELQRDLNRIKKDSDNMHKIGDKMEMKLSQSAQETEEHKNKRLTAKHELMTLLRTLEAEREVSSKLRDSLKFTFTPKALSQQQLLKESLQEFESELVILSRRLGRPLPPSTESPDLFMNDDTSEANGDDNVASAEGNDDETGEDGKDAKLNRSELDSNHLISNLEDETQRVSQCIMALSSCIERMRAVLEQSGSNTCISALTGLLAGASGHGTNVMDPQEGRGRVGVSRLSPRTARYGQIPTS